MRGAAHHQPDLGTRRSAGVGRLRSGRWLRRWLGGAAVGLFVSGAVFGQARAREPSDAFLQQQRTLDLRLRQQRDAEAPLDSLLDWQWGGWFEYDAFYFGDGVQAARFYQQPGLHVWTRVTADRGVHEIFARVGGQYEHFKAGDQYDKQTDWWGPNLERGWYRVDVGRALHFAGEGDAFQLSAKIGRQEVQFGTGYALDLPLDAVMTALQLGDVRVTGLAGKTFDSYPNIDRSGPVDSHSRRCFYGVELAYEGWQRHRPFAYALWQKDATDERPKNPVQEYDYDSQYWGFGSRGELWPHSSYWTEAVCETGNSVGDGDFIRTDVITAYGADIGIEHRFQTAYKPRVAAEYMFASGDAGRLYSPTSSAGGNRGDRKDTSFVGFGFRDTGIAAGFALSNIHIWRAGGAFKPFERVALLRDVELGTNFFLYHKHQSRGAVSDPTANEFEGYLGWEMDYFMNWRLTSDLSWTVRWGTFFPGSAYQDDEARPFVFTGVSWSF
jgi:hypothetical protein